MVKHTNYKINAIATKEQQEFIIDNVKSQIDNVNKMGHFLEIEVISKNEALSEGKIKQQGDYYKNLFGIKDKNLISESYNDMILKRG